MPRCKCCKEKFQVKYFNQKFCMLKDECIKAFSGEVKITLSKEKKAKDKAETKLMREKLKTLSEYEKEARREFQKWIRKRDESLPCISCNCQTAKQWDGGHFLKAELYSGLIFREENCHKQCSQCNDYLSGNELNYRDGLILRYGQEYVDSLERNKNEYRVHKYTKQELIDIKNYYKQKLKE